MLGLTTASQAKSTEKLSSGYKINRAADDAAGLSISEKMRKQIRGLTQASSNAQDGISAVQTAEGALNEVQDMLQRMNELAVKSANSTNSASDREAIQAEIDQLTTEIDRVSETTKFNETYLLKGDVNAGDAAKDTNFQYKSTDVLSQDLYYVKDNKIETVKKGTYASGLDSNTTYYSSNVGVKVGTACDSTNDAGKVESKDVFKGTTQYYTKDAATGTFYAVAQGTAIDATATYYTGSANAGGAVIASSMVEVKGNAVAAGDKETKYILKDGNTVYDSNGKQLVAGDAIDGTAATAISKYYKSIDAALPKAADSVNMNGADSKKYVVQSSIQFIDGDGNEIAANGLDKYLENDGTLKADAKLYIKTGEGVTDRTEAGQDQVKEFVDASKKYDVGALTLKLHVGADATVNNQISIDIKSMSAKTLGVEGLKVDGEDDTNALNAIETIKAALNKVSDQRSALGAVQNRLEHTINNLDNVVENTTSAESQIRDTDMATEMVKYSNNNILAQAGQAMLAQANQSNQGVLSLLQ